MEKPVEHESDSYTNCNWYTWYSHQRIRKETGGHGNKKRSGDHLNDSIVEDGQNIDKRPADLKRLAVTQIPVKDYQLSLMLD